MTLMQLEIQKGRELRQRLSTQIGFLKSSLRCEKDPDLEEALALALEAKQEIEAKLGALGCSIH